MRAISSALQGALATSAGLYKADLYTFSLPNGTIYRWTDFDETITYTYTGDVFSAVGPLIQRSRLSVKNTVEVPELVIKLAALDSQQLAGVSIKTQIHNGYFDGAAVYLDRLFMQGPPPLNSGLGVVGGGGSGFANYPGGLFGGRMSQAKITAVGAEFTIKGANVLMNQYIPRNVYQTTCIHTYCDPGCTLSAASKTTTNTVGSTGISASFIPWGTVPGAPGVYTSGVITMTSGAASGQIRTIKLATAAGLLLQYPFYNRPASGDTFSVLKGCNKNYLADGSGQTCTDNANTQNYRGFPAIPVAETAF